MLDRRSFLRGLIAAPAIIRSPGLLMPIRPLSIQEDAALYYAPYVPQSRDAEFFIEYITPIWFKTRYAFGEPLSLQRVKDGNYV